MTPEISEVATRAMGAVFARHPALVEAILFGSRALGRSHIRSDIDIALRGDLSALEVERIAIELEELPVPVYFDVQALDAIQHPGLQAHIARAGIVVWRRDGAIPSHGP